MATSLEDKCEEWDTPRKDLDGCFKDFEQMLTSPGFSTGLDEFRNQILGIRNFNNTGGPQPQITSPYAVFDASAQQLDPADHGKDTAHTQGTWLSSEKGRGVEVEPSKKQILSTEDKISTTAGDAVPQDYYNGTKQMIVAQDQSESLALFPGDDMSHSLGSPGYVSLSLSGSCTNSKKVVRDDQPSISSQLILHPVVSSPDVSYPQSPSISSKTSNDNNQPSANYEENKIMIALPPSLTHLGRPAGPGRINQSVSSHSSLHSGISSKVSNYEDEIESRITCMLPNSSDRDGQFTLQMALFSEDSNPECNSMLPKLVTPFANLCTTTTAAAATATTTTITTTSTATTTSLHLLPVKLPSSDSYKGYHTTNSVSQCRDTVSWVPTQCSVSSSGSSYSDSVNATVLRSCSQMCSRSLPPLNTTPCPGNSYSTPLSATTSSLSKFKQSATSDHDADTNHCAVQSSSEADNTEPNNRLHPKYYNCIGLNDHIGSRYTSSWRNSHLEKVRGAKQPVDLQAPPARIGFLEYRSESHPQQKSHGIPSPTSNHPCSATGRSRCSRSGVRCPRSPFRSHTTTSLHGLDRKRDRCVPTNDAEQAELLHKAKQQIQSYIQYVADIQQIHAEERLLHIKEREVHMKFMTEQGQQLIDILDHKLKDQE